MTWAIVLLVLALALLIAEAHLPGAIFGVLGIAALVGSGFLFRGAGVEIPIPVVIGAALALGVLIILASRTVLASYRRYRVHTGWEGLVGQTGKVRTALDPEGQIFVEGALWSARSADSPIGVGEDVRIQGIDKLTLLVSRPGGEADLAGANTGTEVEK